MKLLPVFLITLLFFTSCENGPTSPSKSITVLSPNGGEVFHAGSTNIIKWTTIGIQSIDISIIRVDSEHWATTIATGTPAQSGEFTWYIPTYFSGDPRFGAYKLHIEDSSCTMHNPPPQRASCDPYRDESNGAFYITE